MPRNFPIEISEVPLLVRAPWGYALFHLPCDLSKTHLGAIGFIYRCADGPSFFKWRAEYGAGFFNSDDLDECVCWIAEHALGVHPGSTVAA